MDIDNSLEDGNISLEATANENNNSTSPQQSSEKQVIRAPRDPNKFPTTRIRALMRMDSDLNIASQESVYLISKATEYFVQYQAKEAYKKTAASKRKTVQKRDLDAAITECDGMAFLEGAID
ncbi:DNA polymerase epsilon subunit 4-like [Clytia hemisphaerica]|uniref:Transcription factor CBF/NF-Y/archaeal histone domain-containing protein n=1 Tax=Clytia hemisphaerica TaxID=252671 RepID=A0A7M5VDF0_9CNID